MSHRCRTLSRRQVTRVPLFFHAEFFTKRLRNAPWQANSNPCHVGSAIRATPSIFDVVAIGESATDCDKNRSRPWRRGSIAALDRGECDLDLLTIPRKETCPTITAGEGTVVPGVPRSPSSQRASGHATQIAFGGSRQKQLFWPCASSCWLVHHRSPKPARPMTTSDPRNLHPTCSTHHQSTVPVQLHSSGP